MITHRYPRKQQESLKSSPVRVQWDPERSLHLQALPHRSLQLGLAGEAVDRYVDEWTVTIVDITPTVRRIRDLLTAGDHLAAAAHLPTEHAYLLPEHLGVRIGASQTG